MSAQANDVRVVTSFSETRILTGERVTIRIEVRGDSFRNVSRPTLPALIPGAAVYLSAAIHQYAVFPDQRRGHPQLQLYLVVCG